MKNKLSSPQVDPGDSLVFLSDLHQNVFGFFDEL